MKKEKRKKNKKNVDYMWIVKIILMTFAISFIFSFVSEITLPNVNIIIGILIVLLFIFLGVVFDMIGVAVTSADEKPVHSMSARKVKGARVAVIFKQNADKVSSFCNDVIGDICGIISGSAGITIASTLSKNLSLPFFPITLIITALVASLTIGGKAVGKGIAINKSNEILYGFSKFVSIFYKG